MLSQVDTSVYNMRGNKLGPGLQGLTIDEDNILITVYAYFTF